MSRTKSLTPWFYNFDGQGESAGVLPTGVKLFPDQKGSKSSSYASWEASNRGYPPRGFGTKEEAYHHVGAKMVHCPLDGRMVPEGDIGALCRYLAGTHPGEWARLKRDSNGRVRSLYVYTDCYSITRRFKHDSVPGHSFTTKEDMDWALRESGKSNATFRHKDFAGRHNGTTFFKSKKNSSKAKQTSTPPKAKVTSKSPAAPVKNVRNTFDVLADDTVDTVKKLEQDFEDAVELESTGDVETLGDDEGFETFKSKSTLRKEKQNEVKKATRASKEVAQSSKKPIKKTVEKPVEKPVEEPVNELTEKIPSWKDTCMAEKAKREAEAKRLEDERLEAEAEGKRLKEEAEAEEERSKVQVEAERKQKLIDQFDGMVAVPSKEDSDEPSTVSKKGSKKGSKKRFKGTPVDPSLFFS
jgi:hypothetical protein